MTHNETNTSCPQNRCGEWSKCNNGECEGTHDCTCETPIESWEKEFEAMESVQSGGCDGCSYNLDMIREIRAFIRTKLAEAYSRGKDEECERVFEIGYKQGQDDYAKMIENTIHGTVEKNGVAGEVSKEVT